MVGSDYFEIGDLVLTSDGRTAVVINEIQHKKYAGPVVGILVDGEEKFVTINKVKKFEVTIED